MTERCTTAHNIKTCNIYSGNYYKTVASKIPYRSSTNIENWRSFYLQSRASQLLCIYWGFHCVCLTIVQSHFLLLSCHLYPVSFVYHPMRRVWGQMLNINLEEKKKKRLMKVNFMFQVLTDPSSYNIKNIHQHKTQMEILYSITTLYSLFTLSF